MFVYIYFPFDASIIDWAQLNPANNKNIPDMQSDQLTANSKGKQKVSVPNDSDVGVLSGEADLLMQDAESDPEENASHYVSLSQPESIETLRAKLHAKIEAIRSKKRGDGEGNSKDELLEERRLHRAAMRERRRKETKVKIQREKEIKGKTKEKPKESVPPAKVSQLGQQCPFSEISPVSDPTTRHKWRFLILKAGFPFPADERGILIRRRVVFVESSGQSAQEFIKPVSGSTTTSFSEREACGTTRREAQTG